jgi:D-cysteine desulfhydrase
MPRRIHLAHLPTPIERRPALDEIIGANVWVKRDDATGGAEAGNKLRKLEFLLAHAKDERAELVITCGGHQSNHARATALSAARLGMRAVLYLRVPDPERARARIDLTGNVLLDAMAGAEIVYITPDEYKQRNAIMESARLSLLAEGVRAYVVPEGGSNGLGAIGYVEAMREVRMQIDHRLCPRFDVVAHACGSGGTAAGVALGAKQHDVADRAWAFAVCDDAAYFKRAIEAIMSEARGWDSSLPERTGLVIDDGAKGPAYAVMDDEQKRFLTLIAQRTGLVFDPVYTGKAIWGVARAVERGDIAKDANILFLHTGGLPGLLAQGEELRDALS